MKKIAAILITVIICLSFAGCDFKLASIDMLMRPPKLSGENNLLQQAFESTVGSSEDVIMKTPISGEFRSSYLLYDIDGDSVSEALVLYSVPSKDNGTFVSVFKFQNDNWSLVSNIKGRSDEIYKVDFANINGDEILEILISWSSSVGAEKNISAALGECNDKNLTIYSYNGKSTTLIKTDTYTNLFIDDFNGDNSDELLILNLTFSNYGKDTKGRIISFDNAYSIVKDKHFNMTGFTDVYNIVTDFYLDEAETHSRIYVDGSVSENAFLTEIIDISHSDFEITLPFYDSNISSNPLTLRNVMISSQDIDNDGFIEVPTLEHLVGGSKISDDTDENLPLNLTVWSQAVGNELTVKNKCLFNGSYGYMLIFPDEWVGKMTAVYNDSTATLTFYEIDSNNTLLNATFSLKAIPKSEFEENDYGYTKYDENDVYAYGFLVHDTENEDKYVEFYHNLVLLH